MGIINVKVLNEQHYAVVNLFFTKGQIFDRDIQKNIPNSCSINAVIKEKFIVKFTFLL